MMDLHADGSRRIELMDGNTVRLRAAPDGRTSLSILGPAGGHHATVRVTAAELHRLIAGLAMGVVEVGSTHAYRDAMTP